MADVDVPAASTAAADAAAPAVHCPPLEKLVHTVLELSEPISKRMRAIFYLRTLGGDDACLALASGMVEGAKTARHAIFDAIFSPAFSPAFLSPASTVPCGVSRRCRSLQRSRTNADPASSGTRSPSSSAKCRTTRLSRL